MFVKVIIFLGIYVYINVVYILMSLEDKTKSEDFDINDNGWIFMLFLFFGVFLSPFTKSIKKLRKRLYLIERHKVLSNRLRMCLYLEPQDAKDELLIIDRELKLYKIKRKITQ